MREESVVVMLEEENFVIEGVESDAFRARMCEPGFQGIGGREGLRFDQIQLRFLRDDFVDMGGEEWELLANLCPQRTLD